MELPRAYSNPKQPHRLHKTIQKSQSTGVQNGSNHITSQIFRSDGRLGSPQLAQDFEPDISTIIQLSLWLDEQDISTIIVLAPMSRELVILDMMWLSPDPEEQDISDIMRLSPTPGEKDISTMI